MSSSILLYSCTRFLLLLLLPPPPRSTLFPYTTLFRSELQACLEMNFYISLAGPVTFKNAKEVKEVAKVDRKSTRLNSSHVAISYAVFCLKKKKRSEENKYELKTSYKII